MSHRTLKRQVAWEETQQLQAAQLGECKAVSDDRDKFVLDETGPSAFRLSRKPEANGFIRADGDTLLFRHPSEALANELVTPKLQAHLKPSPKGLEFRWTGLEVSDIRSLFAKVRAAAA